MAEFLRLVHRDQLQTSVRRYVHPDTGRQVTLVATMHVGEAAYYAGLRDDIAGLEAVGAVVQCEGSRLLSDDSADATADEQQVLDELRRCRELEQRRITGLGWTGQVEGLGYPPHWQIVDLSDLEIIRLAGVDVMRRRVQQMTALFAGDDHDRRAFNRFRLKAALMVRATAARDADHRRRRKADPADTVLVDHRTTVALNDLFGTDRDTVLVWGAGHLAGLDAGVRERGFTLISVDWRIAAIIPTIRSALWRLVVNAPPACSAVHAGRR